MSTDLGDDEREQIMDIKRRLDAICPAHEEPELHAWEDPDQLTQLIESWRNSVSNVRSLGNRGLQINRQPTLKDLLMAAIPYQTPEINAKRVWVIAGAMHWTWEDMAIGINDYDANRGNISEKTCKTWAWKAGNEKAEITTEQAVMIENAVGQTCATWLITGQHQEYPGFMEPFCGIMGELIASITQWTADEYGHHHGRVAMQHPALADIESVVNWRIKRFRSFVEGDPNVCDPRTHDSSTDFRRHSGNIPYLPLAYKIMRTHWWAPKYNALYGLV